ncbi:MAG: hypothetical protein MH252_01520 [Thermosynechococcaceae cyanobacterium MS004]|nr:hypothetical protein [Thermosynechococcaceae cyanobacterium MS004]
MTQWQFLIQKEGDQDWLPLESSSAEILEGRYQLILQSSQPQAEVDVQIRHEYEMGGILQEVTQRRRQQANGLGQLELFSSTYLPPGLWELKCRVAEEKQDAQPAPPKKLVLQVLAQDFAQDFTQEFETLSGFTPAWELLESSLQQSVAQDRLEPAAPAIAASQVPQATVPKVPSQQLTVSLPVFSKDAAPVVLHPVSKQVLPPSIYQPQEPMLSSPQLPDFLPIKEIWNQTDLVDHATNIALTNYLAFLRRVAQATDREAVHEAFESLEWQQRFLSNLDTLAVPERGPENGRKNEPAAESSSRIAVEAH